MTVKLLDFCTGGNIVGNTTALSPTPLLHLPVTIKGLTPVDQPTGNRALHSEQTLECLHLNIRSEKARELLEGHEPPPAHPRADKPVE